MKKNRKEEQGKVIILVKKWHTMSIQIGIALRLCEAPSRGISSLYKISRPRDKTNEFGIEHTANYCMG